MCAKMAFQHQAGTAMECLSIPITLHKEVDGDTLRCGFKIGGGIDQDFHKSPQGYTDNVNIVIGFGYRDHGEIIGTPCIKSEVYKTPPTAWDDIKQIGIYVTEVHDNSPASRAGLRIHDKILQCNGYDFTMVTHKKAVSYIKKHPVLNLLVARKGVTST